MKTAFDQLDWGNDNGTSCEATYKKLRIYLVCSEKGEYWRICSIADDYDLIKEGWGEDNLRAVFNQLSKTMETLDGGSLPSL